MKSLINSLPPNALRKAIIGCVVGLLLSILAIQYIQLVSAGNLSLVSSIEACLSKRAMLFIFVGLCIGACLSLYHKLLIQWLFTYRWAVAGIVFLLCILFELSGSSIGILISMMGGDGESIVGLSRPIRSDEWAVFTPMAISQCTTDGGVFSYYQDSFRGIETDMFCIYGQPVWDIAVLFRPFQIGYLFLGASKGLSFFWCGRIIFLFMISFEFAYRIIAPGSRSLSLIYALLIALAPPVQWWFSVVGFLEILSMGQLALVMADLYLNTSSYARRLLYAICIGWCLGVYALTFYPAWQIPFAYIYLAILIAMLITKLPQASKGLRDIGLIAVMVAIAAFAIVYVFLFKSLDTILIEMNTYYPGHRSDPGGEGLPLLFLYPFSLLSPINDTGLNPNPCEISSFFSFFPLCFLLPIAIMVKRQKVDPLMLGMLIVSVFLMWYCVLGMPEMLARLTLLDKSTTARSIVPIGFASTVLLVASMDHIRCLEKRVVVALLVISLATLILGITITEQVISMKKIALILLITAVGMAMIGTFKSNLKWSIPSTVISIAVIAFLCGALVNPIRGGISSYFENPTANALSAYNDESDKWAVVNSPLATSNILPSLGKRTLNSTNTYPQLETWRIIDPNESYIDIYNRYGLILITLKEEGSATFEPFQDTFEIEITLDDLRKLGVTKVATTEGSELLDVTKPLGSAGAFELYDISSYS